MNQMDFETQLRSIAGGMEYPATPDIARAVAARLQASPRPRLMNRTLARSVAIAVLLLLSLLIIPPVRAAVIDFIQIGVVRIFRTEPVPAPPPTQLPSKMVPVTATPATTLSAPRPFTATPAPTSSALIPLLEQMAGEMTLAQAQKAVDYPILLPTYPAGLGEPDRVFVQNAGGLMTVLVWTDPGDPDKVKVSLHLIPEGSWAIKKVDPGAIQETQVNGRYAIWADGPYVLLMQNGDMQYTRMIQGHVLIWAEGKMTYRLETDTSMEEAIKIAESLQPMP